MSKQKPAVSESPLKQNRIVPLDKLVEHPRNVSNLALRAALCYNESIKLLCLDGAVTPSRRVTSTLLRRLVTMNTVPHHVLNGNPSLEQIELAYFAGIVDGEGCISIACRKPLIREKRSSFQPRLHITNTDCRLIDWLRTRFGGTLICTPPAPPRQELFTLGWSSKTALMMMQRLLPYLVIKAERAALVVEAWSRTPDYIGNYHPLPIEIWEEYERAYIQLRALNASGSRKIGTLAPLFQTQRG